MSEQPSAAPAISVELRDLFDLAINECVKAKRTGNFQFPFLVLQEPPGGEIIVLVADSTEASLANGRDTVRSARPTVRAYAIAYDGMLRSKSGEPLDAFIVELAERGGGDGFVMFSLYERDGDEIDLIEQTRTVLRRTDPLFT
jgi:hypothetical protein